MSSRVSAVVDLGAIHRNLDVVTGLAGGAAVMAVVKADAYGHGTGPVARTARRHGVDWLGVALPTEALALRALGDEGRILAWLWAPGDPAIAACVRAGIDLSVSGSWALAEVCEAAAAVRSTARVHLKIDSGLTRNGVAAAEWLPFLDDVAEAAAAGLVDVEGIWSHLADSDVRGSATVAAQADRFREAVDQAAALGIHPRLRHLSNSGGLWLHPDCRFDMVRCGIAMYGLSPGPDLGTAADLGLTPAMTLRSQLVNIKAIDAGTSVSYGSTWTAAVPTVVGLVPAGYADGVPRAAGNRMEVAIGGVRRRIVGRLAMDQFVIDVGTGVRPSIGDEVYLFGPGRHGEPTADEWAAALDTIGYEIVTRIGPRVAREYIPLGPGGVA